MSNDTKRKSRLDRLAEVRDSLENLADSDLPMAEDCQRYLEELDAHDEETLTNATRQEVADAD